MEDTEKPLEKPVKKEDHKIYLLPGKMSPRSPLSHGESLVLCKWSEENL
jgi:hypothetical protein